MSESYPWIPYEVTLVSGAPWTDQIISPAVSARQKFEVRQDSILVTVDGESTVVGGVAVRIGFGVTTLPAAAGATPVAGIVASHSGVPAGSGFRGIGGVGGLGEALRATIADPVAGQVKVNFQGRLFTDF